METTAHWHRKTKSLQKSNIAIFKSFSQQVITQLCQIILIRAVSRLTGWPHLALVVSADKWAAVQWLHCRDLRRRPDRTASWSMWAKTRGCALIRWAAVFMCMCVWKWISERVCVCGHCVLANAGVLHQVSTHWRLGTGRFTDSANHL